MLADVVLQGELGIAAAIVVLAVALAVVIKGVTIHIHRDDE